MQMNVKIDYSETEAKSRGNVETTSSVSLSEYTRKLDQKIKKCYVEKISAIKIDPMLFEGKHLELDCLPSVCSYLGH